LKGQEIKARVRKFEREVEPFKAKPPRRTWIVSAEGKTEKEAAAKIEERIAEIKIGKILHPVDKKPYSENDFFLTCRVIDLGNGEKFDFEDMSYAMLSGKRRADPGDNGDGPGPTEDEEIEALERQIGELEGLLEDENVDSK